VGRTRIAIETLDKQIEYNKENKKMADNSLSNIKKLLKEVRHPFIDSTLFELGFFKSIEKKNNKLIIVLAFPFENIPIKDQLIALVKGPLNKLNLDIKIKITVMNQKELQNFLNKEQKNWIG